VIEMQTRSKLIAIVMALAAAASVLAQAGGDQAQGTPPTPPADEPRVAKLKSDAAAERYQPAYLALIGATDVVPQAQLRNPLYPNDDDPYVPSDLPFACDLPASFDGAGTTRLDPAQLLAITRVVGRIPDVVGATDPAVLMTNLAVAATYQQQPATAYQKVFALSAAVWRGSTTLSVGLLPGRAPATRLCPPKKSPWQPADLAALSHFVNCHAYASRSKSVVPSTAMCAVARRACHCVTSRTTFGASPKISGAYIASTRVAGNWKVVNERVARLRLLIDKAHAGPSPASAPASHGSSTAEELRKLADLHTEGLLTEEEFQAAKAKILGV